MRILVMVIVNGEGVNVRDAKGRLSTEVGDANLGNYVVDKNALTMKMWNFK